MVYSRRVLRETPFYQEILEEGREEVRKEFREERREEVRQILVDLVIEFAGRRFLPVEAIGNIRDLETLKQLCLEMDQFPDVDALWQRVLDLAAGEDDSSRMD